MTISVFDNNVAQILRDLISTIKTLFRVLLFEIKCSSDALAM